MYWRACSQQQPNSQWQNLTNLDNDVNVRYIEATLLLIVPQILAFHILNQTKYMALLTPSSTLFLISFFSLSERSPFELPLDEQLSAMDSSLWCLRALSATKWA